MGEKIKEPLKLIRENPTLPIVPMVDGELFLDNGCQYWMGSWGNAYIDEYLITQDNYLLFKSDDDIFDALDKALSNEEYNSLPDDGEACKARYDALPWVKAIVVYINTP